MEKSEKTSVGPAPTHAGHSASGGGSGTKLKHKGTQPHVLHDGTMMVPGEVTEVPAETVTQLKSTQFGKTGKSSWDVLTEGDFEETNEDTTRQPKGKGGAVAPRYTSHLEVEELKMPEAPAGRGGSPSGAPAVAKDDGKGNRGSSK